MEVLHENGCPLKLRVSPVLCPSCEKTDCIDILAGEKTYKCDCGYIYNVLHAHDRAKHEYMKKLRGSL
jgi:hypothetical protein